MKLNNQNKGFTIIEVLIVLAIAGLIMLIVFLAVPALQRNSRNNGRNADAARIGAVIRECMNNRSGLAGLLFCATPANNNPMIGTRSRLTGDVTATFSATGVQYAQDHAHLAFNAGCSPDGSTVVAGTAVTVSWQLEPDINRCITI